MVTVASQEEGQVLKHLSSLTLVGSTDYRICSNPTAFYG